MAEEFLSQDEADTLLAGVTAEDQSSADGGNGAVQDYDITRREKNLRGRLPALDVINRRIARNLRAELQQLTRRAPEVSVGEVEVQKYSEFLETLTDPTSFNLVEVQPLRGTGLIVCDPQLIFAVIDILFGGNGKLRARLEGRVFSPTEQRLIEQIVAAFIRSYVGAWDGIYPLRVNYKRSEMQAQFARIAAPSDVVVSTRFAIELGQTSSAIHVCLPYSMLEPIRAILQTPINTDPIADKQAWTDKLGAQLADAELELRATLAETTISFGDLINLKQGDFVEMKLQESVEVSVNRVPFLRCRYGTSDNHYALKIDTFLTQPHELTKEVPHE